MSIFFATSGKSTNCTAHLLARMMFAVSRIENNFANIWGYHKRRASRTAGPDIGVFRVGPNMLNKMIREQQSREKKAAERQKLKEQGIVNKPIRLSFADTTKTKAFNRLFHQNLLLVLHSPSFSGYFVNSGLTITKVRTTPTFSEAFVYWKTTQVESQQELGEKLDLSAKNIRHEMQQFADIGKLPRIVFVLHKPDGLPMPSPEEVQKILEHQKEHATNCDMTEDGVASESDCDGDDAYAHIRSLKKQTDALGFDRKAVMDKILYSMDKSHPIHEIRS